MFEHFCRSSKAFSHRGAFSRGAGLKPQRLFLLDANELCTARQRVRQSKRVRQMPRAFNQFGASLWRMVSDRATDDVIAWSDDGTAILLKDKGSVQSIAQHYGYKFTQAASFFKQLNLYGFRHTNMKHGCKTIQSFKHETFRRDDEAAAAGMRRLV